MSRVLEFIIYLRIFFILAGDPSSPFNFLNKRAQFWASPFDINVVAFL